MKAIETHYKGYRFRSRLEARWAVFFDALGLKWRYEDEGFEIGNGNRYLPDFYLPDWNTYIEVKPTWPTWDEFNKCWGLYESGADSVLILCGNPGPPVIEVDQRHPFNIEELYLFVPMDTDRNNLIPLKLKDGALAIHLPYAEKQDIIKMVAPNIQAWCISSGDLDCNTLYVDSTTFRPVNPLTNRDAIGINHRWGLAYWEQIVEGAAVLYAGLGRFYNSKQLRKAYKAARSARFEHGETPA